MTAFTMLKEKIMKHIFTVLLVLIGVLVILSMTACNDTTTSASTTAASVTTAPVTTAPCEHSYTDVVTEPTVEAQGFTTHTCQKCGHSYVDTYTDPLKVIDLQYDDYVTELGGISASANPTLEGDDCIEVIIKDGTS